MMDGMTVPTWTDTLDDERSHDENLMIEWAFVQHVTLNHSKKELI